MVVRHSVRTSRKVGGSILRPVQPIKTLSCRWASLRASKGKWKRWRFVFYVPVGGTVHSQEGLFAASVAISP
jgi:hypothetical protein